MPEVDTIVSIVSAFIATISVIFARLAIRRSDQNYSREIITQIYSIYSSNSMRQDMQTVWDIYHRSWQSIHLDDLEKAKDQTYRGKPINREVAKNFILNSDLQSPEYRAVDNVTLLWDYVALLIAEGSLSIRQISGFTNPRILGFLYPIEEAKANHYGYKVEARSSLKSLYDVWKGKYPDAY